MVRNNKKDPVFFVFFNLIQWKQTAGFKDLKVGEWERNILQPLDSIAYIYWNT